MNLTTKQVAQKLGLTPTQVRGLVKRGQLAPANAKPGARVVYTFDPKVVREFKKTAAPVKRLKLTQPGLDFMAPDGAGITSRLDRIENQLTALAKLWS